MTIRAVVTTQDQQWVHQIGPGSTPIPGTKSELHIDPFLSGPLTAIRVRNHEKHKHRLALDFVGFEASAGIEPKHHIVTGSREVYRHGDIAGWCLADKSDAVKAGESHVRVPGQGELAFIVGPVDDLWEAVPTDQAKIDLLAKFMDLGGSELADVDCGNDLWNQGWSQWSGDPATSLNPWAETQDLLGYMAHGWRPGVKTGWGNPLLWGGTFCNSSPDCGNNSTYEFELICLLVSTLPFFPLASDQSKIAHALGLAAARRKASLGLVRSTTTDGADHRITGMSCYERALDSSGTYIPGSIRRPMTSHDPSAGLQWWAYLHPEDPTLASAAEEIRARLLRMPFTDSGGVWIRYGSRPCGWHLQGLRAAYLITRDARYLTRAQEFVDWMDATMPVIGGLHWETPGNGAGTAAPYRDEEVRNQAAMWADLGLNVPASWEARSKEVLETTLTADLRFPYHVAPDGDQMFRGTSFCAFTLPSWIRVAENHPIVREKLVRLFDAHTAATFPDGLLTHWRGRGATTFMKERPQRFRTLMPRMVRAVESWR